MFKAKTQPEINIRLTECIGPAFYDLYWDVTEARHTYYNLKGGRGSLKSSFISLMIVLGIMNNPDTHAVCYRKVADTLSTSVYNQMLWAIEKLGVQEYWHCTVSPMKCEYLPTGQKIMFRGLDKAAKSKSIKVPFGYIAYLWFEEFDEFASPEEIRKVQQSVVRGGTRFFVFKSMNPPKSKANWANSYMEEQALRKDTYTSHTTYLQAPEEWLGPVFIEEAEYIKETSPKTYEHEYLGEAVGNGTEVFDNIVSYRITDEDIARFDHIYNGVDWGWYPDPFHFGKMHYDANRRILWIFAEYRVNKKTNQETGKYLLESGLVRPRIDIVTCDSAEHKSTADYRVLGINARDAEKGPDSVRYGIKWLQGLTEIRIDPRRCPKTYDEFTHYEYELNKDGEPTSSMPGADNHSIDMTRYAMEPVWKRKGR